MCSAKDNTEHVVVIGFRSQTPLAKFESTTVIQSNNNFTETKINKPDSLLVNGTRKD